MAEVQELDGRSWTDESGSRKAERRFQIIGLEAGFSPSWDYVGLPKINDAHPTLSGLFATSRKFEEGRGAEKIRVICTVSYSSQANEQSGSGEEEEWECLVDEWGWDASTEDREFVTDVHGAPVRNSAGDPYDSVPNVTTHSPVFTKVARFQTRQSVMDLNCKVNREAMTIGGMSCAAKTLLCTVAEKLLLDGSSYPYQYTVTLHYRSNMANIAGATTEIGWDVALVQAGMRAKDPETNALKLIKVVDPETGMLCTVTSSAMLDMSGYQLSPTDVSGPYVKRYDVYETATFPGWFTSEPELNTPDDDE